MERLGLREAALCPVDQRDVVEQFAKACIVRAEPLLAQCQCLLGKRHSLVILADLVELRRLTVEGVDLLVRLCNGRACRNDVADRQGQQDQKYSVKNAHLSIPPFA